MHNISKNKCVYIKTKIYIQTCWIKWYTLCVKNISNNYNTIFLSNILHSWYVAHHVALARICAHVSTAIKRNNENTMDYGWHWQFWLSLVEKITGSRLPFANMMTMRAPMLKLCTFFGQVRCIWIHVYHHHESSSSIHHNNWLVLSTHLKHISQNGNLPQLGVKIKNMKPPAK